MANWLGSLPWTLNQTHYPGRASFVAHRGDRASGGEAW